MLFAAFAAFAGFGLVSCSQDESESAAGTQIRNAISFRSAMNNSVAGGTRGTSIEGTNYLNVALVPNMKVWAYYTTNCTEDASQGITQGAQYVGKNGDGVVIKNYSDEATSKNLWDYNDITEMAYWPTQPLNFYAIIPASDPSYNSLSSTVNHKLGHVVADVTIPTTVTAQKDILFAKANNQSGRTGANNAPVAFDFYHALSQIVFTGKVASANLTAEINSITVCNAEQKGKVGYTTDNDVDVILGSSIDASHTVAKFSAGLVTDATLDGNTNVNTAKNLTATDGALMMLPQNISAKKWTANSTNSVSVSSADAQKQTYLAISCKIKNGDAYVMGKADNFATVYIPFEINWEQGKKYTYCLVFGKGQGGFDENGDPISSLLPISYTLQSVTNWTGVDGGEIEF